MTRRKRLKRLIRARAAKTGESYSAARQHFRIEPPENEMAKTTDNPTTDELRHCSFCGKSQKDVKKLVAGPGVYICNDCVALSVHVMAPTDEEKAELLHIEFAAAERTPLPAELDDVIRALVREKVAMIARQHDLESLDVDVVTGQLGDRVRVDIKTSRPGLLIGRGGATIEELRTALTELAGHEVSVNVAATPDPPA